MGFKKNGDSNSETTRTAIVIITGTSPNTGGTANTSTRIELDSNASTVNGAYDPAEVIITAGTGAGQSRNIFEYDGANKYAYLNRDWKVIPDNTSEYMILYHPGNSHVNEGKAQGGAAGSITLNALASAQNNIYLGQCVYIVAGTGADQTRMIVGYNGTTKVATVNNNWVVNPDNTSVYMIIPFPGFVHGVPSQNSNSNILMRDAVGNKTDSIGVPYDAGDNSIMAHLNTSYYHVHGTPFCYPEAADSITITSGAGAWGAGGSITEVIPEDELDVSAFDLHWINIIEHSDDAEYYIEIYSGNAGAEVLIGSTRSWRESSFLGGQIGNTSKRIQIPQQEANKRISCKLYSSNAGTASVDVSFEGHYYAGG